MSADFIQSQGPVLLIGGGYVVSDDIARFGEYSVVTVAADGGADAALAAGIVPDWVVGDMDSISSGARASMPETRILHQKDQDSTDFEKCLSTIDAPLVIGLGFLGLRVDHELAALSALVQTSRSCILIGEADVVAALPSHAALDLAEGTRVSLFPMAPVEGRSTGLAWPIDGLTLTPMGRVGTSNRALGPVEIWMDGAGCLILLPRAALPALVRAVVPQAPLPVPAIR